MPSLAGLPNRVPPVAPTRAGSAPAGAPAFAVFQAFASPTPMSMQYDFTAYPQVNAQMAADTGWTAGVAPVAGSPSQLVAALRRTSVTVALPIDGHMVYVGVDNTVSPDTGVPLYPGNAMRISGYMGAVWSVSAGVATPLYYKAT